MTPESQRIAIAYACPKLFRVMRESRDLCWIPQGSTCKQDVDPLTDLNAMHEAWQTLDRKQRVKFSQFLSVKVVTDGGHASSLRADVVACCENAAAAQRAEAFLRTLNLWDDSK